MSDPGIAAELQATLIRALVNQAQTAAAVAAIDRTMAIAGLAATARHQLEGLRSWLLVLAGRPPPAAELEAMMTRFAAAGDAAARASVLTSYAGAAFLAGRPAAALEQMRDRDRILAGLDRQPAFTSVLFFPATLELARSGPRTARDAIGTARRLSAERQTAWVDPFLGFTAGGIAFAGGDWDDAVAELDAALERAQETDTGWISIPVGIRSYIDAHRGATAAARARLESFRHRGLPLQWGYDQPGQAELAVLEAEGALREAATLARTMWSAHRGKPGWWPAELAVDVARVALVAMDRRLAAQLSDDAAGIGPAGPRRLVTGMLTADPDEIDAAAGEFAASQRFAAEAFAREELACAAAAAGDRDRAAAALEAALAGYRRIGAVRDRDRALGRARALGVRRGPREVHRGTDSGWASLTASEVRIAGLMRDGLTNREIGARLFVSPRTVQTHVSHILQKTGLRSRVEVASAAGAEIR